MASKKVNEPRIYISNASINPRRIVTYVTPLDGYYHSGKRLANQIHLADNEHDGKMSYKARQRLENAIYWLLFKSKPKKVFDFELQQNFSFNINFLTLTLPAEQVHSDAEITNRCLGNFLEVAKNKFGLANYVWKAEAQENGNIHFHVVTDCYMHYLELRQVWNRSTELLGYVSAFELKHKHRDPHPESIRSVKNVRNVASYVACYMSKNRPFKCLGKMIATGSGYREVLYGSEEYRKVKKWNQIGQVIGSVISSYCRPVTSRLWFCSRSLSQCKNVIISEGIHDFSALSDFLNTADLYKVKYDHATGYYGKVASQSKYTFPDLYDMLKEESTGAGAAIRKETAAKKRRASPACAPFIGYSPVQSLPVLFQGSLFN